MPRFIHADLIAQYAQDANETDEPWLRWRYKHPLSDEWLDATSPFPFLPAYEYRRKPRTVRIGEFDVPEPVREPLEEGQEYWVACTTDGKPMCVRWTGDAIDFRWLAAGLIHLPKEAAQQHIDAMLSFTKRGE